MTVHTNLLERILNAAQTEAMKEENVKAENLGRLIKPIFETRVSLNFIESIKEARSRVQDLTSGEIV
ncbi:hypothetical protein Tco_0501526, partial [Tanacetum coccineum]